MDINSTTVTEMTKRLIDAAIYYEQCGLPYRDGARKELNEARSAIEIALATPSAPVSAPSPAGGVREEHDPHRFAVISADLCRPFLLGAYETFAAAQKAQCGSPEKWPIYERAPVALSSPATGEVDEIARWKRDSELLSAIESECWDVRFTDSPNADAGDYNINIEIVGHFMAEPRERVVGENYSENLRAALEQAMTADAYPPARPTYDEPDEPDETEEAALNPAPGHGEGGL